MRFLLVLVVIFSCSVLVSTSHAATVASPGEDASAVKEELATSGSFVKGQRSLEKRTLCGTDSDCQLVASLLPILYPNGARCELSPLPLPRREALADAALDLQARSGSACPSAAT